LPRPKCHKFEEISDALRKKSPIASGALIFAWSDGSGFRERFGFKFGLHVIEYPAFWGTLEAGRKLARERRPPISHNSVDRGVAFGSEQAPGFQAALGELCRIYWYPLYAYIQRRDRAPEEAKDLTQGFFVHLLEHLIASEGRLKV
jgi:hypothetical protein